MSEYSDRTLTLVIPALNEEEAIGETIERCLAVRPYLQTTGGVDAVEIIVVSDGSTDSTAEIAGSYDEVKVIVFEHNRGYGAAIKEGFRQGIGGLVGFLDADGTCDPMYFAPMCQAAIEQKTDVVLGSRLGADSKMPRVRRLGNRLYAFLLGILCGRSITDTASGMRVIRREALARLYPLPNGLHFTPAMSARALMNGLSVVEVPMPYEERVGNSKLKVVTDGLRFLRVILEGVLCYRPERLFLIGFASCLLIALFLAAYPTEFYWQNGEIEEWMIYRFIACFVLGLAGFTLLCIGILAHRMIAIGPIRRDQTSFWPSILAGLFTGRPLVVLIGFTLVISVALVWAGLVQYVTSGQVTLHWSRVLVGAFGLLVALQTSVTAVMLHVIDIWQTETTELEDQMSHRGDWSHVIATEQSRS